MKRGRRIITVILLAWFVPLALFAQERASVPDQIAIEIATANYLQAEYKAFLAGMDSSWALDPRVYIFPARPVFTRADLRQEEIVAGTAGTADTAQRSSEIVAGRGPDHLQALTAVFRVHLLKDTQLCVVAAAAICRFGSNRGLIWITSATTENSSALIQFFFMTGTVRRGADGTQSEQIGSTNFTCELQKESVAAEARWSVTRCNLMNI